MAGAKTAVTPMMAQFLEIKEAHKDALLFYRMGDFYELFFEDAVSASEALDIALTKRGKHLGKDIPMCGVPFHSAEGYLLTLIRKGFRVAVCEQLEDPSEAKKRGSKSVVRRGVVRLVTPGTLTEESLLEARRNNFLAAVSVIRNEASIAWADISTGEFRVMATSETRISAELSRLAPKEVIVAEDQLKSFSHLESELSVSLAPLSATSFESQSSEKRLREFWKVNSLDAFGAFERAELSAMGALLEYLELTQKGNLPLLATPVREIASGIVQIDAATRRNLELTKALSGEKEGSLLSVIDRTVTASGGRLLERRLSSPSRDLSIIEERLGEVAWLCDDSTTAETLRQSLRKCPDIERSLSRLSLDRGGPRDLAAIRNASAEFPLIGQLAPKRKDRLSNLGDVFELLDRALVAEPPLLARDGGFISAGFDSELDEVRSLRDEGRGLIAAMQGKYASDTGISTLKIKHNNVLGYFIETTSTHAEKMLAMSDTYIHRQTTANAVRFTTLELSELETRILNAGARVSEIELAHYESLRSAVLEKAKELADAAQCLAELDVDLGFATIAREDGWTRPVISDDRVFNLEGARHPVVESALKKAGGQPFIANDCLLGIADRGQAILLTGPNMAGKSTYLRQNALIALLAQTGSFVPAERAEIGLVSQIFSRVGASDDLARGRSTFMVEMVETAAILNQADDQALVILDEIGRGTATYDGLSIAWATLEHLHDKNKCRALFATHYHEMTELADSLDHVKNATVAVKEWKGEVVFLHEVRTGAADRSYGIQVARLAGLPTSVIERARLVLNALEKGDREGISAKRSLIEDLPLFSSSFGALKAESSPSVLEEMLSKIQPDNLTPKQALDALYELKSVAKDNVP